MYTLTLVNNCHKCLNLHARLIYNLYIQEIQIQVSLHVLNVLAGIANAYMQQKCSQLINKNTHQTGMDHGDGLENLIVLKY